jgi:hypothetical protein
MKREGLAAQLYDVQFRHHRNAPVQLEKVAALFPSKTIGTY